MGHEELDKLTGAYIEDRESVYHTWFMNNEDRLKAFRTIKKGLRKVISEMEARTFGNDFKGSSLETVVSAISEQKQVFEGAAHPFFWKPKLRIPDIYENPENQLAFGRFLNACLHANHANQIFDEIVKLDQLKIKASVLRLPILFTFFTPPFFHLSIRQSFAGSIHYFIKSLNSVPGWLILK
ncbi:hypothetical protein ABWW58_11970 [Sporolactobacillus sp. STCC-11]|uniref:hypothetical protein n=1 Tax=Sporolactobacillus caesalpiniae TaxID=3230362 RepID=UPI0033923707